MCLKEAIKAFDGTAIIVSHDREFLDGLVDKVYEFGGGKVREHLGGIYDYLRAHNAETIQAALAKGEPSMGASSAKPQQRTHRLPQQTMRRRRSRVTPSTRNSRRRFARPRRR